MGIALTITFGFSEPQPPPLVKGDRLGELSFASAGWGAAPWCWRSRLRVGKGKEKALLG